MGVAIVFVCVFDKFFWSFDVHQEVTDLSLINKMASANRNEEKPAAFGAQPGERPGLNPKGLQTVPYDPRFQNTNQVRNCWQNYVDYHRCINLKGEEFEPCKFFWKNFNTLCPVEWVEKWDEQRENNAFPAKLCRPKHH